MRDKPKLKLSLIALSVFTALWCLSVIGLIASALVWIFAGWSAAWPIGLAALILVVTIPIAYMMCYRMICATRNILRDEQPRDPRNMSSLRKRV